MRRMTSCCRARLLPAPVEIEKLLEEAEHALKTGDLIDWDAFPLMTWDEYGDLITTIKDEAISEQELFLIRWCLVRWDLYFALTEVISTKYYLVGGTEKTGIIHPEWLFDRCREVQGKRDRVVDVWSRFHWKSNIKSTAMPLVEVLRDPNITIVIFSHTRPLAKKFLAQIQREIETNYDLQNLSLNPQTGERTFPFDRRGLVRNSLDHGIIVPRVGNPREGTFEAYGFDSLPTGGHWQIRLLDDASVRETVTTSEQIKKSIEAWELTQPLGMPTGRSEEWVQGTLYSHDDLYTVMWSRGYEMRLHPCYKIDQVNTEWKERGFPRSLVLDDDYPVLYQGDKIEHFLRLMGDQEGSKNAMLQMRCDPNAGEMRGFSNDWLKFYQPDDPIIALFPMMRTIVLVDSANEKDKDSDYTCFWVLHLGWNGILYVGDIIRDRLNLVERGNAMFRISGKYNPAEVRYERYGIMVDVSYILERQKSEGSFRIVEVAGSMSKNDRIERLIPWFESGRIRFPISIEYTRVDGTDTDLVPEFIEDEYENFPNARFRDMLDSLSRLCDVEGFINTGTKRIKTQLRLGFMRGDQPDGPDEEVNEVAHDPRYYELGARRRRRERAGGRGSHGRFNYLRA